MHPDAPSSYLRSRLTFVQSALGGVPAAPVIAAVIGMHLLAAWNNGGYLNPDEHFQILEFAQFKLGRQPAGALAWEFAAQMRPALQPWIADGAIRLASAVGVASPFLIAFGLRIVSTVLAMFVGLELCVRCVPGNLAPSLIRVALGGSFLFWIAPITHGRFGSEASSGVLLAGGLCLVLDAAERASTRRISAAGLAIGAGLVWSAAFYCRFQIAFSIAGAGLWLLFIRRAPFWLMTALATAFIVGVGLNQFIDHWLYGSWVFSPYNYVMVNLVGGKANTFGVSPWWALIVYMLVVLIPPYSVVILALLGIGSWYARRHVLVWLVLPLIVVHMVLSHKEPRFLIPVLLFAGPWLAVCLDALPRALALRLSATLHSGVGRALLMSWAAINLLLLCVTILVPANDRNPIQRWLWDQSRASTLTVWAVDESPYAFSGDTTISFYRDDKVVVRPFADIGAAMSSGPRTPYYVYYRGLDVPPAVSAIGDCVPTLRSFPQWLVRFEPFRLAASIDQSTICRLEPPTR